MTLAMIRKIRDSLEMHTNIAWSISGNTLLSFAADASQLNTVHAVIKTQNLPAVCALEEGVIKVYLTNAKKHMTFQEVQQVWDHFCEIATIKVGNIEITYHPAEDVEYQVQVSVAGHEIYLSVQEAKTLAETLMKLTETEWEG